MTGPSSDASENLYAPPQAATHESATATGQSTPFYVVSVAKVVVLMFVTVGIYQFYWFWRHWKMQKIATKLDIWPVARAIFSIFFTHNLFGEIDLRLKRERVPLSWAPSMWATLYVVAVLAARIANRLPDELVPLTAALAVTAAGLAASTLSLAMAQRAANHACGDPAADANRKFTWVNWIWIVAGSLFWVLVCVGAMSPEQPQ